MIRTDGPARWGTTFAVADAAFARATDLGARVVTPLFDTETHARVTSRTRRAPC